MPTRIDDAGALKALAHPLRVALLAHLVAAGPATASSIRVGISERFLSKGNFQDSAAFLAVPFQYVD